MKIIYDPQVDAVYVRLAEKKTKVTTHRLSEDIAVNYGPGGDIVGIEILSAREHLRFKGDLPVLETSLLAHALPR